MEWDYVAPLLALAGFVGFLIFLLPRLKGGG
jgi:hypothetical protein